MKILYPFKILFLAFWILLFWGCSGYNSVNQPYQATMAANITENANIVNISAEGFGTSPLNVIVGTTVTWINNDSTIHTVTSDSGLWDSGPIQPGAGFSLLVSIPGSFTYHCAYHPSMTGAILASGPAQH